MLHCIANSSGLYSREGWLVSMHELSADGLRYIPKQRQRCWLYISSIIFLHDLCADPYLCLLCIMIDWRSVYTKQIWQLGLYLQLLWEICARLICWGNRIRIENETLERSYRFLDRLAGNYTWAIIPFVVIYFINDSILSLVVMGQLIQFSNRIIIYYISLFPKIYKILK